LSTTFQGFYKIDQAVCKESVGKKWGVGTLDKESAAIIMNKTNGFGIIRIFIVAFADIGFNHIVKHLESISYHHRRFLGENLEKFLKGYD